MHTTEAEGEYGEKRQGEPARGPGQTGGERRRTVKRDGVRDTQWGDDERLLENVISRGCGVRHADRMLAGEPGFSKDLLHAAEAF